MSERMSTLLRESVTERESRGPTGSVTSGGVGPSGSPRRGAAARRGAGRRG